MFALDNIMSTDLITVLPSTSLADARSLMRNKHIHHLPVTNDNGNLIGLLTQTDVLAATDSILRDKDSRIRAREIDVADVMVKKIATVSENTSLRQAALFLEKNHIGCLPIVKEDKLVGIITDTDFVGVAINLLEQLETFEPDDSEL